MLVDKHKIIATARSVLDIESEAISALKEKIDTAFVAACSAILACQGRVILMGIGKSGHIARKMAATFASTGTPAFFIHPAEASHGDIGMITDNDLIIVLSYSGEAKEILSILPFIKRLNIPVLALTGAPLSSLSKLATLTLDIGVIKEACPLGLAPTASTTAMLAMGDALALSVLEARGFTVDDFAKSHPGGQLGRRLLLKIEDIMHTGSDIPRVHQTAYVIDALVEMSQKRLGFTTIVDKNDPDCLMGIFTDGDLRRTVSAGLDIRTTPIQDVMTQTFKTIAQHLLAAEAINRMQALKTLVMPVTDAHNKLVGALNMHDLLKAGVL